MFEITLSKIYYCEELQLESVLALSKQFEYSYQSKCVDRKNAMIQLNHLHSSLLHEDGLDVLHLEATRVVPSNYQSEICISLVFEVNNLILVDKIVDQFNAFTAYLDSISLI